MTTINPKLIKRFEATTVYSHPRATADIIFVHGLNGGPAHTWTGKNDVFWPLQLLVPSLINTPANIIVYGYNADVASWTKDSSPSENFVYQHAQDLVTSLTTHRRDAGTPRNPIIWVCHSLGGILLKRALLYSNDVRDPALEIQRSLYVSTYGIIFLGTPHTGSNLASWGRILQAMSGVVPKKILNTEPVLLKTLKKDNVVLQEINNHFLDIYQRFKIHMVRENKKTDLKYTVDYVVDNKSAGPQLPGVTYYSIEATHSAMCKFETAESPGYSNVSSAIRDWIQEAPDSIQMRWTLEEEERNARAINAFNQMAKQLGSPLPTHPVASPSVQPPSPRDTLFAQETLVPPTPDPGAVNASPPTSEPMPDVAKGKQPAVPPAPLSIHPYQFKPNAYFKGREPELEQLHSYLRNPDRLAAGTSAVLLQSLPGGGKSHLARQYIQIHGSSYPGGVFWIRAKSEQEMADAFWKIASSKIMQDSDDQSWRRGALEPNKMVETVRRWFESFEGWLIVFDGIHFDGRHEPDFIPHAKNTSILYTSTNRAATGDYRFDNPMLMELGQLSKEQAQELLLEEMGRQPPFHKFDLLQAGKAVELMDRLPLMIHVAGQHLKVTREPLAKYTRSFNHTREAGILDAYKNVKEDLQRRGAVEALNLVHILCFFAPIIPVEMLVLGLDALDNRTPIKTADAFNRKSINNTLSILIKYALVGRNEDDGGSNTSSPNKHRHGHTKRMAPEFLDTLRIHSIIQRFFRNDLGSSRQVAFWLERAIAVYCRSYDVANVRIRRSPRVGLPDDYRRYRIHGEQLLKHVDRLVKKHESLLGACKLQLEERLDLVEAAVEDLTKVVSIDIMSGRVDKVPKSVFEISSSSCSDSSSSRTSDRATPVREDGEESGVGARDGGIGAWVFHQEAGVVESPGIYDDMAHHEWHDFPYPRVNMIPMPLLPEDLDPSDTEYSRTPRPPMPFYGEGKSRDDPAHHRTVKKMEERRYNDRKASMREVGGMRAATAGPAADPRIHVTHDNAKGRMFNSMPSDLTEDEAAAVRAERERRSEAKSQLMRISSAQSLAGAVSGAAGAARNSNKSQTVSGGASSSGNASNNGNGNNGNRSNNILQLLTMPFKRNVGQSEGGTMSTTWSPSASTVRVRDTPRPMGSTPPTMHASPDLRSATASGPSSYGGTPYLTRTPSQESWAYHQERMSRSDLAPSTGFQQHQQQQQQQQQQQPRWEEGEGFSEAQGAGAARGPVSGGEGGGRRRGDSAPPPMQADSFLNDEDLMAGLPRVETPLLWREGLRPTGYTSQPMSRQTSENKTTTGARLAPTGATPRSAGSLSFVPPGLLRGGLFSSRNRRPSQVETEPSPRLDGLDSGVLRSWDERHGLRGRVGGGATKLSSSIPAGGAGVGTRSGLAGPPSTGSASRPISRGAGGGGGEAIPGSGGFLAGGAFVSFGEGETQVGEVSQPSGVGVGLGLGEEEAADLEMVRRKRDQDLTGVGLGILEG